MPEMTGALRSHYRRRTRRIARPGAGAVTLELILALPILLIAVFAIVQFGIYFASMQQVALACRVGAEEASQTPGLPLSGGVPANVMTEVLKQLENSCIDPCAIILEHNEPGMEHTLRTDFDNDGDSLPDCPLCQEPTGALPTNAVRLTICVDLTELMPNCLATWGFDLAGTTTHCSVTFGHE